MPYMVTFTINIPQMLAYIPYMDPMGNCVIIIISYYIFCERKRPICPSQVEQNKESLAIWGTRIN